MLDIIEIDSEHHHLKTEDKTLVEHVSHAHDAMQFFMINGLPKDPSQYQKFAGDLFKIVTQEFGGKTSVEIADSIQGKERENIHNAMKEAGFVNLKLNPNVIAISRKKFEENIINVKKSSDVADYLSQFEDGTYQIITDRNELLNRNEEILELLEKSGYLPSSKVKEGLYSELGMRQRFLHSNALPVAILHKNQVIGCAFLFFYGNDTRVYVHDLTLAEDFRHQGVGGQHKHFGQAFFVKLYELSSQHSHVQRLWLIGGGDANTAKLREHIYKDILGGESIVALENDANAGIYINFKPPGPRLVNAGQRENKEIEITYSDGYTIKIFPARPKTLSENDQVRIKRLEEKELLARKQQKLQEEEKLRLSTSLQALKTPELGVNSPSKVKPEESISQDLSGMMLKN